MTMETPPIRFSWLRDRTTTTTTPTLAELRNMSLKRRDCGGDAANTPAALMVTTEKKRTCIRKDCEGRTSTAMETCRRKDCGGDTTNPSAAVMEIPPIRFSWLRDRNTTTTLTLAEMRNMSLKRRDCGGDTSTAMETCRRKNSGSDRTTDTTSKLMEIKKKRAYRRKKYLPHDLIVEQILTKLPVPALLKSVQVSELWYNSIHIARKCFTHSHFLQSKKQPRVIFSLLDVRDGDTENTDEATYGCHFFKFTTGLYGTENPLKFDMFRVHHTHSGISELVGYCNGLPCMAFVGDYSTGYIISDPNKKHYLYIFCPAGVGKLVSQARIICHGFGFDRVANEYKVVSIFRTTQKELNFVVFTLGTKSWRDVSATTTPISGHGGRPITKIRAPTGSDKSAIFCTTSSTNGGFLVWKVIVTLEGSDDSYAANSNEKEMLMSFNLHDEKFQFIQLPAKSRTDEHQKHLLVDYPHLLEFKGFPSIARIEKRSSDGNDYPHRFRDDHKDSSSCCCCCKVLLYILKDKVEQAWVKEESFDVRINSSSKLAPDPCCFCFGSTTTPPTRIFGFSGQILLYWFNGKYFQVYNLCSEKFQLVLPTNREERDIFRAKMKEPRSVVLLHLQLASSVSRVRFCFTGSTGNIFKFTTCVLKNFSLYYLLIVKSVIFFELR